MGEGEGGLGGGRVPGGWIRMRGEADWLSGESELLHHTYAVNITVHITARRSSTEGRGGVRSTAGRRGGFTSKAPSQSK